METYVTYHKRSTFAIELILMNTIVMSYLIWTYYLGVVRHIWVYGILKNMNSTIRILFLSVCFIFINGLYFVGIFIHKFFWTKTRIHLWPKQWSPEVISKDHEFEDFRVRQRLIKTDKTHQFQC